MGGRDNRIVKLDSALRWVSDVAQRRHNEGALAKCSALESQLAGTSRANKPDAHVLDRIKGSILSIASDLLWAVKFEMREIVIPFIEVKGPTHAFGVKMFPDYFQWIREGPNLTAEEMVGILEEDVKTLEAAIDLLKPVVHVDRVRRRT